MKEKLINLGFEKWLGEQELAPYLVMFWDTPKFIQLAYIQKFLREEKRIDVNSLPYINMEIYGYTIMFDKNSVDGTEEEFDTQEKALEAGILKAVENGK